MSARKIIANLVGLAGSVVLGWGMYGVTLFGGCGRIRYFEHECPPESYPYFIALFVGLVVTIGAFRYGGWLSLGFLFLGLTGGPIWAGTELPPDQRTGSTVAAVLLIAAVVAAVAVVPFFMWRDRWKAKVVASGSTAIGTITDIRDTGATINKNPHVELIMRIEPLDGSAAFNGEKAIIASRVDPPYRGQRFPVWFDPADHGKWVMVMKLSRRSSPAVRRMYELAKSSDPGGFAGRGVAPLDTLVDPR